MNLKPVFKCSNCGKQIDRGDFISIIGKAPGTGVSMPMGRADKIFADIGEIYCEECLPAVVDASSSSAD